MHLLRWRAEGASCSSEKQVHCLLSAHAIDVNGRLLLAVRCILFYPLLIATPGKKDLQDVRRSASSYLDYSQAGLQWLGE